MSPDIFTQLISLLSASKYPLLFFGTLLEGPIFMMVGGVLYRLEQLSFWPMYAALVAGDFVADLIWYAVGYFAARPLIARGWGRFIDLTPENVAKIEERFHRYHTGILIVSKLTMGFGFALATLMVAGMLRVPLVRYAVINLLCGLVWTLFLIYVGYFFGNLFALIPAHLQWVLGAAALVIVFFGLRALNRYFARADW